VHPSSLLRIPSGRDEAIEAFTDDLRKVARQLQAA
jgi:hypothetical protein